MTREHTVAAQNMSHFITSPTQSHVPTVCQQIPEQSWPCAALILPHQGHPSASQAQGQKNCLQEAKEVWKPPMLEATNKRHSPFDWAGKTSRYIRTPPSVLRIHSGPIMPLSGPLIPLMNSPSSSLSFLPSCSLTFIKCSTLKAGASVASVTVGSERGWN